MSGFTYLASPYTSPDLDTMIKRYEHALACTHWLLKKRIWVYSPIVHCHPMALQFRLPPDAKFWFEYNTALLAKADRLLILTLPRWEDSSGIQMEIEFAKANGIPVSHIKPSAYTRKERP